MIDLKSLRSKMERASDLLRREAQKEEDAVLRAKQREVDKIRNNLDKKIAQQNDAYKGGACGLMIADLDDSLRTMNDRSIYSGVEAEDIERANKLLIALRDVNPERAKEIIELTNVPASVVTAMTLISNPSRIEIKPISSFISPVPGNQIYLITPLNGKSNSSLAKSLEGKIDSILDVGEIVRNASYVTQRGQVDNINVQHLAFDSDLSTVNGFYAYNIKPETCLDGVLGGLVDKFKQLQPEGFKEAKLVHGLQVVEPEIVQYFLQNDRASMVPFEISTQEDKPVVRKANVDKANSRFYKLRENNPNAYVSQTREGKKEEALRRLDELNKDVLNSSDVAYVLGIKGNKHISHLVKKGLGYKIEGRKNVYPSEEVRKYIDTRVPSISGWEVPGAKKKWMESR